MKTIALVAAAAASIATFSTAASAQGYNTGDVARAALTRLVPGADVSALSNAEAVAAWTVASDEVSPASARAQAAALIDAYTN